MHAAHFESLMPNEPMHRLQDPCSQVPTYEPTAPDVHQLGCLRSGNGRRPRHAVEAVRARSRSFAELPRGVDAAMEQAAEGYRAVDERRAANAPLRPS